MENIIVVLILVAIAAGIIGYLVRAKKRGETCIGCPYAKQCSGNCNGGCHTETTKKDNPETNE